ncbi:MAG: phosphotransferase [Patescibacteria group bacterium]|nr:phosphotransferase [Patescibacteria group bacterium]MDD4610556.1 phosphotransferase [Patescibacteria group bacterium]
MNIINNLFSEQFVIDLFRKNLLPHYSDFSDIKKVKVVPHKQYIWEKTYHVVLEFSTVLITKDGKEEELEIFCTAHSSEPRQNAYEALRYLWDKDFSQGDLTTPHPLFFDKKLKAFFYRGVSGRSMYYYIKEKKFSEVERIIPLSAAWFSKLHSIPVANAKNFNEENSRIMTVVPGKEKVLDNIKNNYPDHYETYKKIYEIFIKNEEDFLKSTSQRWLIHGDAHPENIIKMGETKIAGIDFTDVCLADFARDLGSFLQQIEYMAGRKIGDFVFTERMKDLFLVSYLKCAKIELSDSLKSRIDNYYNWTAIRTATFFLMKHNPQPDRAEPLLNTVRERLGI